MKPSHFFSFRTQLENGPSALLFGAKIPRGRRVSLAALTLAAVWFGSMARARAEEGGFGHYLIGSYASSVDFPSNVPGLAMGSDFFYYGGSIGGNRLLPLGGALAAGLNANVYVVDIGASYTFQPKILGAHYSIGLAIPYLWTDTEADASFRFDLRNLLVNAAGEFIGPKAARIVAQRLDNRDLERTLSRKTRDTASGLTDIALIPAGFNWTLGEWQLTFQTVIYAPTGDFEKGRLANPGKNYWTFDPIIGATYTRKKTNTEFTILGGYAVNTMNDETDYRSGDVVHLESTLQQFFPLGSKTTLLGVGVNGFLYDQVTGDSGAGAVFGGFEDRSIGVGPILTFVRGMGKSALTLQAKWLPEIETRNRLRGNLVWFSAGYRF